MKSHWQLCAELESAGEEFAVITLVGERGHVPQDLGAKAIVTKEGLRAGTVGGGKVEAKAIRYAQERLANGTMAPELLVWNLTRDVGMTCGGEVSFLFESHGAAKWKVAVFGAGHVAQALVPILSGLDCRVYCADPRAEWVDRLPNAGNLQKQILAEPKDLVAQLDEETFFLCLSQGHAHDLPVLKEIYLQFPGAAFVGVIGSEVKASAIRRDLLAMDVGAEFIEKIHCPVGLPLGTNHPGEIAVSIAAQLLQIRG